MRTSKFSAGAMPRLRGMFNKTTSTLSTKGAIESSDSTETELCRVNAFLNKRPFECPGAVSSSSAHTSSCNVRKPWHILTPICRFLTTKDVLWRSRNRKRKFDHEGREEHEVYNQEYPKPSWSSCASW